MGPDIETIKVHAVEIAIFQLKVHGADESTIEHVRHSIINWVGAAYRNGQIDSYEAFGKRTSKQHTDSEAVLSGARSSVL